MQGLDKQGGKVGKLGRWLKLSGTLLHTLVLAGLNQ